MSIAFLLVLVVFLLIVTAVLYIPLPSHIADREKIQFFEFLIRLINEYLGDLLELIGGPRLRNQLSRFVVGFPFFFQFPSPSWCHVENRQMAGVNVRVYTPKPGVKRHTGVIVFIHGGGWCLMKANYYDGPLYSLIAKTGITVVSVDYRRAPEVTFPTPIVECENVVRHIYETEHENLGVDRSKIFIMGDSAGGNLSAVVTQRLHRAGLSHYIRSQILIYPVINVTDFQSPSYQYYHRAYKGTGLLNPKLFARMVLLYLGIEADAKNVRRVNKNKHIHRDIKMCKEYQEATNHNLLPLSFREKSLYESVSHENHQHDRELAEAFKPYILNPDLNPLFGKNLDGLPGAMVITTGIDILRDEGVLYVKKLESHNVPVQWFHYDAAYHGILNMPISSQRKRILQDITEYVNSHP